MAESAERPERPYLYDAFISYRHVDRDRRWAEWLIEALERYRVPRALQDQGYPPRLRKVFRDVDEAPASSDLTPRIASFPRRSWSSASCRGRWRNASDWRPGIAS